MTNLVNNLGGAAGFGENFVPRNDDYYTSGKVPADNTQC